MLLTVFAAEHARSLINTHRIKFPRRKKKQKKKREEEKQGKKRTYPGFLLLDPDNCR
jgi:hypothetical protein